MVLRYFRLSLLAFVATISLLAAGCGSTSHHVETQKVAPGPSACAGGYQTQYGCQAHSPTFGLPPQGLNRVPLSSIPTFSMDDSVSVSVLPSGVRAYAGYLFGNFVTFPGLVTAFPSAVHVPIVIHADEVIRGVRMACIDDEPGDEWPVTAAVGQWALAEIRVGVKPCEYSALRNGMAQVEQELANVLGPGWRSKVFLWDADWTGSPRLDAGFDATQWLNHGPRGENYDQSSVTSGFLSLTPGPKPVLDIGGAEHYERYVNVKWSATHSRERNTIMTWDRRRCERPARRLVCTSSRAHMILLLGRDQAVYHRETRAQRDANHIPGRIQGLSHRLNNGHGVVRKWL